MLLTESKGYIASTTFRLSLERLYGAADLDAQQSRWSALLSQAERVLSDGSVSFFSAPGRSELGGNHTDHQRGCVLAAAINLDSIAIVVERSDNRVKVWAEGYEPFEINLTELGAVEQEKGSSAALVRGVAAFFRNHGHTIGGFEVSIQSTVLRGSGLSSSASFEVLIGGIFNGLYNLSKVQPVFIARAGQFAENEYFGKPCGLMDQLTIAAGGLVGIDFCDPIKPLVRSVPFDIEKSGLVLAVVDTGGNHADLTQDYAAIPAEMSAIAGALGGSELRDIDPLVFMSQVADLRPRFGDRAILRALHFFGENERAVKQFDAVSRGDVAEFLTLVRESGLSSVNRLQNINSGSGSHQGIALALALSQEFLGAEGAFRVHGGGFAGTIQAWIPQEQFIAYKKCLEAVFGLNSVSALRIRTQGVVQV